MIIIPKQTFLNLTEQRQQEILNACYKEFAGNDFNSASLTNIIKQLGIAKGSFYRYFIDKQDVYDYILHVSRGEMATRFNNHLFNDNKGLLENWINYIMSLKEIENKYPQMIPFRIHRGMYISLDMSSKLYKDKYQQRIDIYKQLIAKYSTTNELREGMNPNALAEVMASVMFAIINYLSLINKTDSSDGVFFTRPDEETRQVVKNFMDIIAGGILA